HVHICNFVDLMIKNEMETAQSVVDRYISDGCSAPNIVLELLCKSAQLLGEQWCSDETTFADVTIGLAGLHQILRRLDRLLSKELVSTNDSQSILLLNMPGDTHIFGLSVLETFFRNSGWTVESHFEMNPAELVDRVSRVSFDVVGFSVACDEHVDACNLLIKEVRKNSLNNKLGIMAGGSAFIRNEHLKQKITADVVADDAVDALQTALTVCSGGQLNKTKVDHV
ncbi:MAG: cobalamin B12-binding domain-containing protein, partial [Pseudomonadota bacterium]